MQCEICENNMLKVTSSIGIEYYRLNEHDSVLSFIEGICGDGETYYYGTEKNSDGDGYVDSREISIENVQEFGNKYSMKEDIEWCKLANFDDVEDESENIIENKASKAYELYVKDRENEYPDSVSHAVQNYIVNAGATMSIGEIPSNSNMVYVIEDEFRYDSELEFQWEYTALKYGDCEIVPMSTNYVYSFVIEDYLLDYCINDDFDEETETFSGIVYFEYRIVEESNTDNVVVKDNNETVCLEFTVKYSEEHGHYRLIDLKYLASTNECDKYADCDIVGHDWEAEHKCDTVCIRCGTIKGECIPGEEATCNEGQYCSQCNKLLEEALGHKYSSATCDSPAKCVRCGYIDPSNDELGHEWIEREDKETLICNKCGIYYCSITSGTSWHNIVDDCCIWCGKSWK